MTPMIDMTFQLIAFFMVLVNFSEVDAHQEIRLPQSRLAKPPDKPLEQPLTLQVTKKGMVIIEGDYVKLEGLPQSLATQARFILDNGKVVSATTVIIRADSATDTGIVQEVIRISQEAGFEKFALRAEEKRDY